MYKLNFEELCIVYDSIVYDSSITSFLIQLKLKITFIFF